MKSKIINHIPIIKVNIGTLVMDSLSNDIHLVINTLGFTPFKTIIVGNTDGVSTNIGSLSSIESKECIVFHGTIELTQ